MKPNRKNTKKVLIDLCYGGSMNEFEEFYGYSVTYQELEQQSYIEFKQIMFENIDSKIKFRKYGRIGPVLTIKAEMYDEEIKKFEDLINNNKIQTIYGWIVKDVVLINDDKELTNKESDIIVDSEIENNYLEEEILDNEDDMSDIGGMENVDVENTSK